MGCNCNNRQQRVSNRDTIICKTCNKSTGKDCLLLYTTLKAIASNRSLICPLNKLK